MKSRPMIFSSAMVRAILAGQKTQTRRVVKGLEADEVVVKVEAEGFFKGFDLDHGVLPRVRHLLFPQLIKCPYGVVGDRLWVKETTIRAEEHGYQEPIYAASELGDAVLASGLRPDPDDHADVEPHDIKLRPSMFMPRKFCRTELEITGIRVERVQNISEADARSEGITDGGCLSCGNPEPCGCCNPKPDARDSYIWLWHKINGKKHPWSSNPWVWVVEFKRVEEAA